MFGKRNMKAALTEMMRTEVDDLISVKSALAPPMTHLPHLSYFEADSGVSIVSDVNMIVRPSFPFLENERQKHLHWLPYRRKRFWFWGKR